jgi:hypothetical protein
MTVTASTQESAKENVPNPFNSSVKVLTAIPSDPKNNLLDLAECAAPTLPNRGPHDGIAVESFVAISDLACRLAAERIKRESGEEKKKTLERITRDTPALLNTGATPISFDRVLEILRPLDVTAIDLRGAIQNLWLRKSPAP